MGDMAGASSASHVPLKIPTRRCILPTWPAIETHAAGQGPSD